MRKRNLIISAAILGLAAANAQASLLYSATVVRTIDGDPTDGAPAYSSSAGANGHILFDDAFIAGSAPNSVLSLDSISVGLIQSAHAAGTNVNIYVAPMLANTTVSQGANGGNDPDDVGPFSADAVPDVGTPILLGTLPLVANGTDNAQDVLLTVNTPALLAGYTGYAGKLGFYIGVEFGNDNGDQGWAVAKTNAPAAFPGVYQTYDYNTNSGPILGFNLDVAWDYTSGLNFDEFAGSPASDLGGDITTAFWASASGTVVPEPASMGLLAAGGLMLIRRKR